MSPQSDSRPLPTREPPHLHLCRTDERVILQFTGCAIAPEQRMASSMMCNNINSALVTMRIRVRGASFTRASNIAVTPLAPCTVAELICHTDILKECAAHGELPESVVVELDGP